jgi:hypothetical protein
VHTRLVIEGWDVRVIAEASGVFVRGPGEVSWNPLAKGGSATLRTGSVVACGRRQLHYHSYRSLLR